MFPKKVIELIYFSQNCTKVLRFLYCFGAPPYDGFDVAIFDFMHGASQIRDVNLLTYCKLLVMNGIIYSIVEVSYFFLELHLVFN